MVVVVVIPANKWYGCLNGTFSQQVTLAKLLCDNCDNVESEQRSVFDLPDPFL